jgi:type IV secretory pathway VirB9-like protein
MSTALHARLESRSDRSVLVTTTKRTYLLKMKSVGNSPTAIVRWRYPTEVRANDDSPRHHLLPDPSQPAVYYTGYSIDGGPTPPAWLPRQVLNDAKGFTYIVFPSYVSMIEAPMVRLVGPTGPSLVNPRLVGRVMTLTHLIEHAMELRLGVGDQAEVVRVTRGELTPLHCPGAEGCPQWFTGSPVVQR